ncbi:phenylalanine--tRNA ligase subunit alpha [Vulcanisaeta souniana]|uniref:Phenylalanine--tRNA ligase alpha subunit n=1 Tax=Vulcanisaeta souniana JCM 11219 TaxID=1293586 RepID=A0A830EC77_9CREN|nr:phenylalanine--tRNA ligase subunit alpha [Vulcanisaeta souniana]BDR91257.1 phenylalanyl--tRNA ligase subunit alpha [Vulcanisaeta souniana JCM 11219]GGI85041.1 phenylalanyl--tRNA ligase subunit alpha [Vulcanisaeta souniana JCM 11219]
MNGNRELILPPQEFDLLKVLRDVNAPMKVEEVASRLGTDVNSLMRSIAELENLGLILTNKSTRRIIELTEEGRKYVETGLPEVRLVKVLLSCKCKPGINDMPNIAREHGISLSLNEINYALSSLTKMGIIRVSKGIIELTADKNKLTDINNRQETLSIIGNGIFEDEVPDNVRPVVQEFMRRGIVKAKERSIIELVITDKARELLSKGLVKSGTVITALTPELITSGNWRNFIIKKFDLSIPPPQAPIATKHFFAEFIKFVKEVFVSLGFEEVYGPHIELEFWNFDALFQAQDHPAREIHDTYFLKYPSTGKLLDNDLVSRVAHTHEDGWITGSRGWGYKWDPGRAVRLVLRTQTTSVSVRTLHDRGDGEYRAFTIDRVFRPEILDPKHSMEFNQADGIVVGEKLSFKHLLGVLEALARGMGMKKVMFKPAYFPFTSPSAEGYAYHEKLGWIEFVGSGIFRPEVVMPLGIRRSRVLAFGMGLDRIAMILMNIEDIRDLFSRDLNAIKTYWSNYSRFVNNLTNR